MAIDVQGGVKDAEYFDQVFVADQIGNAIVAVLKYTISRLLRQLPSPTESVVPAKNGEAMPWSGVASAARICYDTDAVVKGRTAIMGITYIQGQVSGPKGKRADVKFLVDSGATYSVLPHGVWRAIGLKPKRKMSFTLADGTAIERSVSEVLVTLPQGEAHTPVVLGENGDHALLGVVTLEILGLVFNPFDRTLQPMRMLMC